MQEELKYPLLSISRLRMETDGEGVTTLIAGAGCPLDCRWCINKKVLKRAPEYVTAGELYDRVKIDDLYFRATCGGITFGGGESLLHAEFINQMRKLCPGWKIYAETSLWTGEENIKIAAGCIDGFIVDIKTLNPDIYKAYTGRELYRAEENLELLLKLKGSESIRVRVPLIPQFNDDLDRENTSRKLREMGISRIEFFDYVIRE